jgi:hypothetical protein
MVENAKPAVATTYHPLLVKIDVKVIPVDVEITKIGEGYLVNLLTKL